MPSVQPEEPRRFVTREELLARAAEKQAADEARRQAGEASQRERASNSRAVAIIVAVFLVVAGLLFLDSLPDRRSREIVEESG